jgi:rfaE bifunctional protein kinase chain/domain
LISAAFNMKVGRTVLVSGHFNVLHPGHLRLLRFAKEYGGRLIVAVESDRVAGVAAHVPEQLRLEGVRSNSWVDEAFLFDNSIEQLIATVKPDVIVKGKEHEARFNAEEDALRLYGGRLVFSSGESLFSSLDLIRKEFNDNDYRSIHMPSEFMARHGITVDRLAYLVRKFEQLRVCVIGDLIVDEYITCQPLGMSQEDPTIVVTPIDSTRFIGGAGIVAAHAAGLGASVDFISVVGNDATHEFAKDALCNAGVKAHLNLDDSRPTTLKQRYRSKGKSLLRVSHLHQSAISASLQAAMLIQLEQILPDIDVLVFSDFNYGCLPQPLVSRISQKALEHQVLVAADSQSSSQVGDISRFQGMNLITPTEREARIATRNHEDGLVVLAESLRKQSNAQNILLKMGEEGLLIHADAGTSQEWLTDRVDALNSSPKDVAGAGDSLLIAAAMALAAGASIWEAACLGSLAAAVQVGRVGNTPLQATEITKEFSI